MLSCQKKELLKNAGEATRRTLNNILDSEYHILNQNDELIGNFLLESPDFKSFNTGLTELLIQKGYTGNIDDAKAKYHFFHFKCKEQNISFTPSVVKSWFQDTRPISSRNSRKNVYKICFALRCTLEETITFFYHVYFECPFNFRVWQEAVYYFCFKNQLDYNTAVSLSEKAQLIFEDVKPFSQKLLYTHTRKIGNAIDSLQSSEELLAYLEKHKNEFLTANRTAYDYAEKLIQENTSLALEIFKSEKVEQGYSARKTYQQQNIDLFLLVLFDFDMHQENKEHSLTKDSDFPDLISSNFISKENISRILHHEKVSYDTLRKNLMILEFFNYFAHLKLQMEKNHEIFLLL